MCADYMNYCDLGCLKDVLKSRKEPLASCGETCTLSLNCQRMILYIMSLCVGWSMLWDYKFGVRGRIFIKKIAVWCTSSKYCTWSIQSLTSAAENSQLPVLSISHELVHCIRSPRKSCFSLVLAYILGAYHACTSALKSKKIWLFCIIWIKSSFG